MTLTSLIFEKTNLIWFLICSQIQFLTSGGGSRAWKGDVKQWDPEELKLYYEGQGFMSVEMTKKEAKQVFYDVFGNVLHKWSHSKELDLAM